MINFILISVAIIALIIGSITDIKKREVPDWLNYGLIFAALGIRAIYSAVSWDWMFFLEGIAGFIIFAAIAFAMFYAGQWGGGDAKLLMGLGALIGLGFDFTEVPFMLILLFNILIVGGVYGLVWSIALAVRKGKIFSKKFSILLKEKRKWRLSIWTIGFALLALDFVFMPVPLKFLTAVFILIIISGFYLFIFIKIVEECCMLKYVKTSQLTEGDWIAKDIFVKGKRICGPKDLGISKENIRKLIKLKIRKILIKDGIPFVPSFLIGYLITLILGNWLILFM